MDDIRRAAQRLVALVEALEPTSENDLRIKLDLLGIKQVGFNYRPDNPEGLMLAPRLKWCSVINDAMYNFGRVTYWRNKRGS